MQPSTPPTFQRERCLRESTRLPVQAAVDDCVNGTHRGAYLHSARLNHRTEKWEVHAPDTKAAWQLTQIAHQPMLRSIHTALQAKVQQMSVILHQSLHSESVTVAGTRFARVCRIPWLMFYNVISFIFLCIHSDQQEHLESFWFSS
jgi:hypothetical protein